MKRIYATLMAVCFALALLVAPGMVSANDELLKMQKNHNDWVMPSQNYSAWRYSKLDQINPCNVGNLKVAWSFSTGTLRGHEGNPLVIGDMMYIVTSFPNNVYALILSGDEPGKIVWMYKPVQDPSVQAVACCDNVNRGLSYADGKIFLNQLDGHLVALDRKTGRRVWEVENADPKVGGTMTGAPFVMKDKVIVGISGGEFGVRGHVTAYSVGSGKLLWRAYSTGPDSEVLIGKGFTAHGISDTKDLGIKTWQGDAWKIGGGTTWGWFAFDPALNLMYYGTGNPSTWNPDVRPGDNKWSMTLFARDVDTGMARWGYQMTPHDEWDYDGINEMILTDQKVNGKMVKAVTHFDRNGFAYVMDRVTGELLQANKFDLATNWATHIDIKSGLPQRVKKYETHQDQNTKGICPAALGSKDQQPAAWSPKTKLFYVPTNHVCMDYEPFESKYTAGQPWVGATLSMYPGPSGRLGNFIAYDINTGKIAWTIPEKFSVWSGALATGSNLVFYGTLEGYLKAVDAKTGKLLWKHKTPSGIIGNVMTYTQAGKQYIAVFSGIGGWAGIGLAAGLEGDTDGLGAVGAYRELSKYTALGGVLTVYEL